MASSFFVYSEEQKKPRKPKPELNKHNDCYICISTQFLYIVLLLKDVLGNVSSGNMKYENFFLIRLIRKEEEKWN